jgi:hypothetical protein
VQDELLKLQKIRQFPDDLVKIEVTPDVLGTAVIKEITLEGRLL